MVYAVSVPSVVHVVNSISLIKQLKVSSLLIRWHPTLAEEALGKIAKPHIDGQDHK
jgi:hypothetical protein